MRRREDAPPSPIAGIGLKPAFAEAALAHGSTADFFELHAENAMLAGGAWRRRLACLRERWPLSVHGVGLSLGGAERPDPAHLGRLAEVVRWLRPRWVSEHLAWSSHGGRFFADLLPPLLDADALRRVSAHVEELQEVLGRQVLIENPAAYLRFDASTLSETAFLAELVRRTGCGLLLDVSNVCVGAANLGFDAEDYVRALPAAAVKEIHLAGWSEAIDPAGVPVRIDDHGSAVPAAAWALYGVALAHVGAVPTLIERDHDVPSLPELEAEASRARAMMQVRPDTVPAAGLRAAPPRWAARRRRAVSTTPAVSASASASLASVHETFSAALVRPEAAVPPGLSTGGAADAAHRYAVHRNNVVAGLVAALGDGFPAVRASLGRPRFAAAAADFVRREPPRSPVLAHYGMHWPAALDADAALADIPWLGDLARLEWACHAAQIAEDATPWSPATFADAVAHPERLLARPCRLHPSLAVVRSGQAVVSRWFAHRDDEAAPPAEGLGMARAECAAVMRDAADAVWVVRLSPPDAVFVDALRRGRTVDAAWRAAARIGAVDLAGTFAVLMRHGALVHG